VATAGGGVAIQTWMLDDTFPGDLRTISRPLAHLDAQGPPKGSRGTRLDARSRCTARAADRRPRFVGGHPGHIRTASNAVEHPGT
jgi:hypothetical protein